MRIVILSIALLFLAFSAQSQVLKSAGVWYFLDVDSMTARPAVLPNGTEIAYVVGTRDIYCWNRTSSAWEICVPAVDSTVFATLHAVGDSIAAALGYVAANYFPLQGGLLTGTAGNGFVGFPLQSSPPATPSTGFSLFAGSTGNNISWMQPDGFFRRLVSPVTGTPRQYQFMARSYTLADSADVANNVTSIAANYLATSNGTNLVARNLFDDDSKVEIKNGKPLKPGQWSTAGRPSGTAGYIGYNTGNWPEWYDGTRWNLVPKSDRSAFTDTYVPFTNSSGQLTQASATGQNLRYYNAGSNLHILEVSSAIEAKGVAGVNLGNADIVVSSATNVGRWSFSTAESTGTLSFYDAISAQTPVTIAKNSGNARISTNSTTTALSAASLLTGTVGSTVQTIGNATDALGGTGTWRIVNGSNIFSITPTSTSPYFAITNGTQRGYFQATTLDGIRIGSSTAHPFIFLTNATARAYISATGDFAIGNSSPQRKFHVTGEARISDLTTDTPTQIVGADADGDLGALGIGGDLSITSGVLSGLNGIYSGSGTVPDETRAYLSSSRKMQIGQFTGSFVSPLISRVNAVGLYIYPQFGVQGLTWQDSTANTRTSVTQTNGGTDINYEGDNYASSISVKPSFVQLDYRSASKTHLVNLDSTRFSVTEGLTASTRDTLFKIGIGGTNRGTLRAYKYGTGAKKSSTLGLNKATHLAAFVSSGTGVGTIVDYPLDSIPTNSIYNNLPNGNVRVDANTNSLRLDSIGNLTLSATNHTSEFGTGTIAQIKKLNASGTKYFDNYRQYDSRTIISNGTNIATGPSYSNLFIYNRGSGEEYEWTDLHVLDTTNNVFGHMYGARYKNGLNAFRAQRPSSGGAYNLTPAFDFLQFATGNGAPGSNVLGVRVGTDSLFSVKQNGSIEADKYGAGNKEAADLSKTVSAYASVYATDGTLLEYPLADLGGSSILDSLSNGSISIDANGNSLNISNLDELTFTGYSADIRGQNSRLLLDDDDATLSADNNVDISAAGELTLTGLVVALQEAYNEVTSTTSPVTLSSTIPDNLINQGGTQATFTLNLPPSPIDGQVCTITYVNNITTLTLDGNGTTVIGSAVTTGVPGSQRKYKYYAAAGAWVKIY